MAEEEIKKEEQPTEQPKEEPKVEPKEEPKVETKEKEEPTVKDTPKVISKRPEYIPEKFWNKDTGEPILDEMGKSYSNLEKFVGGKKEEMKKTVQDELQIEARAKRPPSIDKYELPKLPEGITEDMVRANPMTDWWRKQCWEQSGNQEIFEEGINKYVDMYLGSQVNVEEEKTKLGENADARIDAVNSWASTFFNQEQFDKISGTLGQSADGIEALEKVIDATKHNLSRANQVTQPDRPLTLADVKEMMRDKKYFDSRERDPAYVKKVDEAFSRLYRV
jgi:hypothetical protein|tara:strand:+ start:803 stop:1636 length:834 start_codon:yes stop_codon:yes gene_type:complete